MNRRNWQLAGGIMWMLCCPAIHSGLSLAAMDDLTRSRLQQASSDPRFEPWQREFMSDLAGGAAEAPDSQPPGDSPASANGHWYQLSPSGSLPPLSYLHSAIYDPTRNRMVIFGGAQGPTNDTWVLTFSPLAWSQLTTAGTLPPGRWHHTAIYDSLRDREIIFGGSDSLAARRNDVWALSFAGTPTWSQLSPSGTPPTARMDHEAVYDQLRDRMLVFGGWDGFSELNETWALSLATPAWSQITPSGPPPTSRLLHALIYDPVRDRMVIFGGRHGASSLNDVWALPLTGTPAWSQLSPTGTIPSARLYHSAIYDPVRDRMVIFGGSGSTALNDSWALSLAGTPGWTQLNPTGTLPVIRGEHTAIYDPVRDRMVVFAGVGGTPLRDTWMLSFYDGPGWVGTAPTFPIHAFRGSGMWDPLRDRMLIFGGETFPGAYLNAVWTLALADRSAWNPLPTAGLPPEPRSGHAAIYDPVRDRMVVFGGEKAPGAYGNDTWSLSLAGPMPAWEPLSPLGLPPTPRRGSAAIYDPVRDRLLIFGGRDAGGVRNDSWVLALGAVPAWSMLATSPPPAPRERHTAIYDAVRDRVIIFGGRDAGAPLADTWELSLTGAPSWSPIVAGPPPAPRCSHVAVYDAPGDRMIVFGGDRDLLPALDDTWSLSFTGVPAWTPLATAGMSPSPRFGTAWILDPARECVIVCGGFNGIAPLPDTWELAWGERTSVAAGDPAEAASASAARGDITLACAPNPFNPVTTIHFLVSTTATVVTLDVLDSRGRLVRRFIDTASVEGDHTVIWDGRDERGRSMPSGVYFARLHAGRTSRAIKLVLSK